MREKLTGGWTKWCNREILNMRFRLILLMRLNQEGRNARDLLEMRNAHKILSGKPEGKRPLERLRRR
jgi:hypothetical protein